MAKRIEHDYAGMLAVYDNINKTRPLTEEEIDRVHYLTLKLKKQQLGETYKASLPDDVREARREARRLYAAKRRAEDPERARAIRKKSYDRNRSTRIQNALEYQRRKAAHIKAKRQERFIRQGRLKVHIVKEDGTPVCNNERANLAMRGEPTCERCINHTSLR